MSILESMRSGTDSTAMQVVLALVLVSFVFWYSNPAGDKSQVVATVNGTRIMDTDFGRAYRRAEQQYERALSEAEAAQLRERVRQQLIEDEVIRQEAVRLGLEVSDTEVARQILALDFLKNDEGRFDSRIYESWLRQVGYASRSEFEDELREGLLRDKLRTLAFIGVTVSEPMLRRAFVESNTRIDLEYVRVRPGLFTDDVELGEERIDTFLAEQGDRVQGAYEADFDRLYNHPEQVRARLIRLRLDGSLGVVELRPRLEELRAQVEAGGDMAELARKFSEHPSAETGGDLGLTELPQLPPDVATAVAGLEPGQLSEVVATDDHLTFYRLEERVPASVTPLQDVQREIAARLIRESEAPALAAAYAEDLQEQWTASGEPPRELLAAQEIVAAKTGPIPLSGTGGLFSPPPPMLEDAADAEPGAVLPEVYQSGEALWVGQLEERIDADMDLFETQKEQVRQQVLYDRRMGFYQGWVDSLVASARIQ